MTKRKPTSSMDATPPEQEPGKPGSRDVVGTAGTGSEPVGTQLITLDPEKYVTAVFASFRDRLEKAKTEASAIAIVDVTTPAGMKIAIGHRAAFRAIRIEAEAARKARKQPILDIGKLLDSRYKQIETEVTAEEDRFDAAIKADEERKEIERAKREQAARERIEKIQAAIIEIRAVPIAAVGKSSADIESAMRDMEAQFASDLPLYAEFAREAQTAMVAAKSKLHELLTRAREHEAALEQARRDREELERRRAEEDKRQREAAEREAAEIRARAEAYAKRRAEIEAEERAARERIEAQERAAREAREAADRKARERLAAQEAEARARQEAEDKRLAAERERLAAEARAIEEAARAQREATEAAERRQREEDEAKAKALRDMQEEVERERRAKAEQEQRAAEDKARKEQEARDAAIREANRKDQEQMDARQMLLAFVVRFGHLLEFAKVCKAIDVVLNQGGKKEKAAA